MPEVNSLKSIREEVTDPKSASEQLNEKAITDLRFLCSRMGYGLLNNVDYKALYDAGSKKLCDFLVVGHEGRGKVSVPGNLIKDDKMYVAVVLYNNGTVKDAYLFAGENFMKPGLFSIFKRDKKNGTCYVDMSNETKTKPYSFGNVVQTING